MSGPSDPDIAFAVVSNDRDVSIVDVFLSAGQGFWSTSTAAANNMFLLESNPATPSTFIRNRSQAGGSSHSVVDGCRLWTATCTGRHAIVVIGDRPPTAPGSGGIAFAFALHRYNPAKPTSCPVRARPRPDSSARLLSAPDGASLRDLPHLKRSQGASLADLPAPSRTCSARTRYGGTAARDQVS